MKKCSACKATKPLKEFYIYHPVSGGKRRTYHRGICKKCILASDKEKRKDPKVKKKLNKLIKFLCKQTDPKGKIC